MNKYVIKENPSHVLIRRFPEKYWGENQPTRNDIIGKIVNQLLSYKATDISIKTFEGEWCFVGAEIDWLEEDGNSQDKIKSLFENIRKLDLPGSNAGGMRCEVFIYDFAEEIVLWNKNILFKVKGECASCPSEAELLNQLGSSVFVGFRGNTYHV